MVWLQRLVRTDADIWQAVEAWCCDPVAAEAEYGHISQWHTQHVTDMSKLFLCEVSYLDDSGSEEFDQKSAFNEDISGWDVSNVPTMQLVYGARWWC